MPDTLAHSPTLAASGSSAVDAGERLQAGQSAGEYVVESFLGGGAMGEVYAGRHPVIGKRVAIKVLRRDAAGSEASERLIREARATSQIDHPNVIDIFALGRLDDGRLYLVMDLVDGKSLRDTLRAGPLAPDEALSILDAIADALDAAHARGVIHRDLKPDNIMLDARGRVHVLDFGLAKLVQTAHEGEPIAPGTLTGQGTWLGTPGYMAPEQWSVDGAGPASDRYALGVIAFELLSGVLPFAAASVPAMMEQHFRAAVPSVSSRGAVSLPSAVDGVLARALAKDPAERFASAREMIDALREAMGTAVRQAMSPKPRTAGRKLWLPAAAGAGVLGVGIVAAVAMRPGTDAPAASKPAAEAPSAGEGAIAIVPTPDTAEVSFDGRVVAAKRVVMKRGASTTVVVRAPGYAEVRRTLVAGDGEHTETLQLAPVSRFEGVWRMADGDLRAFARQAERVDVFKLDAVSGPRRFFRHYAFATADHGVAFATDEEMVDSRAPDDPSCHLAVHVEYRYDPDADTLELHRDRVKVDLVDGHCIVRSHDPETSALVRVDEPRETHELAPPAGLPPANAKPTSKKLQTVKKPSKVIPFDTVGKKPPSPYTNTKQAPVENIFQAGDSQQAQNPPAQVNEPVQAPRGQKN